MQLKHNIKTLLQFQSFRYIKDGVVADIKFEPGSENGWAVCGNDWSNALIELEFPITKYELIRDGWKRM